MIEFDAQPTFSRPKMFTEDVEECSQNLESEINFPQNALCSELHKLASETGPISVEVGLQYMLIGNEAFGRGCICEAQKYHKLGSEVLGLLLPQGSQLLADCSMNLGNDCCIRGKMKDAMRLHVKAFNMYRKILGDEHINVGNAMNSLANDYFQMNDWGNALKFQREAVKIFQKLRDGPLAEAYNNLGNVYFQLTQYRKARYYLHKAVHMLEVTHRSSDLQMGNATNNLGNVYYALGNPGKALRHHLVGFDIRARTLPPFHSDLANSYNNIGNDYSAMGNLKKAREYLTVATRLYAESLPGESAFVSLAKENLKRVEEAITRPE